MTLNNLTVGRSVLEALRLLKAFQAVAKHGVLCPVDWKPNDNAAETINTISNTLTENYEDRLANLQRELGVQVTDLDEKHKHEKEKEEMMTPGKKPGDDVPSPGAEVASVRANRSNSIPLPSATQETPYEKPGATNPDSVPQQDSLESTSSTTSLPTTTSFHSAPPSTPSTPISSPPPFFRLNPPPPGPNLHNNTLLLYPQPGIQTHTQSLHISNTYPPYLPAPGDKGYHTIYRDNGAEHAESYQRACERSRRSF